MMYSKPYHGVRLAGWLEFEKDCFWCFEEGWRTVTRNEIQLRSHTQCVQHEHASEGRVINFWDEWVNLLNLSTLVLSCRAFVLRFRR